MLKRKSRKLVAAALCSLVAIFASSAFCVAQADQAAFFADCIRTEIERCKAKARYLSSRSPVLREYARSEIDKAEFLIDMETALVEEMIASQVGRKRYQVEYFLNGRFEPAPSQ